MQTSRRTASPKLSLLLRELNSNRIAWLDALRMVALTWKRMKTLSREQLERRKAQAVRFTRDVLGDDDRADEIEDESLQDYADRRRIQLANPERRRKMPIKTRRELLDRIEELEGENEELQSKLDEVADLVAPDEDDDSDDDSGED